VPKGIRINVVAPGPYWTPLQVSGAQKPDKLPNRVRGRRRHEASECNGGSPGAVQARDGRLWFPTMRGVVSAIRLDALGCFWTITWAFYL
jgi:NAD(P)-dependent dehydrogenase (short-subunit alcohol dehydrogenase family)